MKKAIVTPKSSKAKNRLANNMGGNQTCVVEQHKDHKVFLVSETGEYSFWVDLNSDPNWIISL